MKSILLGRIEVLRGLLDGQKPAWVAGISLLLVLYASCSKAEGGSEWATVVLAYPMGSECRTGVLTDSGAALDRAGCHTGRVGDRLCVEPRSLPDLRGRAWYWEPSTECEHDPGER